MPASPVPKPSREPAVSARAVGGYELPALRVALAALLAPLGGMERFVKPGQRVLVKPNLLAPLPPERAVTTHPAVVEAVVMLVQEAGGVPVVGDSPGVGQPRDVARSCGVLDVVARRGAFLADFTQPHVFREPRNAVGKTLTLVQEVHDADVVISVPKLKNHGQMVMTAAVKNQFGLVPGMLKGQYHFRLLDIDRLADLLVDINRVAAPALTVLDAIVGMEGEGPSSGEPRSVGVLAASDDVAAMDLFACALIGLDPATVPTVQAARRQGFGPARLEDVQYFGDPLEQLAVPDFKPIRHRVDASRLLPLPRPLLRALRKLWVPVPRIDRQRCTRCFCCRNGCPVQPPAIDPDVEKGHGVDLASCIRCYCCSEFCPEKAVGIHRSTLDRALNITGTLNVLGRGLGKAQSALGRLFRPRKRK